MTPDRTRVKDAILDEIDDTMMRIGRIMSQRHVGEGCHADPLTMSQAMLARALHTHGPAKMSEVAAMMGVKPPAASAAVDALERDGLVERSQDPDDRRVTVVCLTEAGLAALQEVDAKRREGMRNMLAVLSEDDISHLVRIHRILLDAMVAGHI